MSTSPNIPAGSTIRQSPDGSWQYQSRSVGPWLPMPAPQTQPPLPVAGEPVSDWPTLQWTKNIPPNEQCRYDHCIAETPFGRFLITWKSWKDYQGPTVDETPWGDWWQEFNSVDEAKAACQQGMNERLAQWGRPTVPPAPRTQPPFPVEVEVAGPSVAEIDAEWLATWCEETGRYDVRAFARAILARWGRPATPPAPEPEIEAVKASVVGIRDALKRLVELEDAASVLGADPDMTAWDDAIAAARAALKAEPMAAESAEDDYDREGEIAALILDHSYVDPERNLGRVLRECDFGATARAILARWGRPATPPAPADPPPIVRYEFEITDEHHQTVASGDAATLEEAECEGRHYLAQYQQDGPCTLKLRRVEVLEVSSPEPAPAAAEPPLWRVMQNVFNRCRFRRDQGFAAQILAVRDWVAPEEAPPVAPTDSPAYLHWQQRQAIRALLTFEAARAEAEAEE